MAKRNKQSIMQTLLAGFMVPVLLMIILGLVSYRTASDGMLSKYKESAMATVSAVGNYCSLVCDSISSKALEMISDSDVGAYYEKYYKKTDAEAMDIFRSAKSIISKAKSINKYVYSCSVIPENGSFLSTLTGSMTENPYEDFTATTEGNFFVENPTLKNQWMGYHTYLDEQMSSQPDNYALTFFQKLPRNNTTIVMDLDMNVALDMLSQMDFGDNSIRALVSGDNREIISIQGREEETIEETYFVGQDFFESTRNDTETGSRDIRVNGKKYVYIYTPIGKTGAVICALIPQSNLLKQVGKIRYLTVLMVIIASVAALAIGGLISNGISKAVKTMTTGLSKASEGNLCQHFETKRKDEFKVLTCALNSMLNNIRLLIMDMKQFGSKVSDLSAHVYGQTNRIDSSMQDIQRAMDEVAKGVQNQALDTESSNQKMISFTENINAVTEKTQRMSGAADEAIDAVEQGKVIVEELSEKSDTTVTLTREMIVGIEEVWKSSEEIKAFVQVINSIAEQTNLLSLNASIEAARAGQSGRGFAVVAEEIRKLADQSKESGARICGIVENIGASTDKTTTSAKKAEGMISDQVQALSETVQVFGRIHNCVVELVNGIHQVTQRLEQIEAEEESIQSAIQNISSVSEQVAASTQEVTSTLDDQADVIKNLSHQVKLLQEDAVELGNSIDKFEI